MNGFLANFMAIFLLDYKTPLVQRWHLGQKQEASSVGKMQNVLCKYPLDICSVQVKVLSQSESSSKMLMRDKWQQNH